MELNGRSFGLLGFILGLTLVSVKADMSDIVNVCCDLGTNWAKNNDRCDSFYGAMPGIHEGNRLMCQQVVHVCCLKSKQDQMCTRGMTDGLKDGARCAVRDDIIGSVTYTECCQCCQMGRSARQMGMECKSPSIGDPCDLKFKQCCTGNTDVDVDDVDDSKDTDVEPQPDKADTDECALFGADQLCSQICINTIGSFRCECESGYQLARDGRTCYRADCQQGFAYNTVTGRCEDIDECVIGTHDCHGDNQICRNQRGSFYCQCDDGYHKNRTTMMCEDIDECARHMDNCESSQRCENTVGSFSCRRITPCGTGWTLDDQTQACIDQNECEAGTHNCGLGYECYNIEGSFRCNPKRCPEGYRFNSATAQCEKVNCPPGLRADTTSLCVDINECESRENPCQRFQSCQNTYGSFRCIDSINCGPGYEVGRDGTTCVDIDECTAGTHDCRGGAECINRPGSYVCSCPPGYSRVGSICEDKDECQYGNVCPSNSVCENTRGSFRCVCDKGFEQSGSLQCRDIDECDDHSICSQGCTNLVGSYVCTCESGFKLAADGRTCVDIDECRLYSGPGVCAGDCINTPGSYMCSCPAGWKIMGNSRSCQDIDECSERTDNCGNSEDVMCFNTRGSHRCPRVACPSGFSRSDLGPRRNSDVVVESDSVLCKKFCSRYDINCRHNETTSVSYQFFSLPTIPKIERPAILLNITAQGFILIPQMFLHIISGNEENLFDTQVEGDTATFRLVRPLIGPKDHHVMLRLENRSYVGNRLLSAHNAHLRLFVSPYEF